MKPGQLAIEARKALQDCDRKGLMPKLFLFNNAAYDRYIRSNLCGGAQELFGIPTKHVQTDALMHFNGFKTEIILITAEPE